MNADNPIPTRAPAPDFAVGDRVRLRPDARNVLDVIRRQIGNTVGEVIEPDGGDFDWVVRFPEGRRVGGRYAFDDEHLMRADGDS